jgi:ring-1,2-phenylacetyl-CoA epoxidase subunit PaaD
MVSKEAVLEVLRTINDPEMPISIVDLGIVANVEIKTRASELAAAPASEVGLAARDETSPGTTVTIDLLPTFIGCPALHAIEEQVRQQVSALLGVAETIVHFRFDPPWDVDRISPSGREALRQFGVTVPEEEQPASPQCPYCGSSEVQLESTFGPTRCRMIYYCNACRNPFEHMKSVRTPLPMLNDLTAPTGSGETQA